MIRIIIANINVSYYKNSILQIVVTTKFREFVKLPKRQNSNILF